MMINGQGLINFIRDAPEHTVKANVEALPTLNMAASLLSRSDPSPYWHASETRVLWLPCL